jgi:hypothetical protein
MEKAKSVRLAGRDPAGSHRRSPDATADAPTLRDLGISKKQSSDWQRLAAVPRGTIRQSRSPLAAMFFACGFFDGDAGCVAVSLDLIGNIGFGPVPTSFAPHEQPDLGPRAPGRMSSAPTRRRFDCAS